MSGLLRDRPHRRLNALTGEWVFVSPQRVERPWQGRLEIIPVASAPPYDSECYLCPGNLRASGERNPSYESTYVFGNDFPAFLPDFPTSDAAVSAAEPELLFRAKPHAGTCRVVCYSPRHDLTLAELPAPQIRKVVDTWASQVAELGERWRWVQLLENKGEIMGCSNPHPHGQIWAGDFLPNEPAKELEQQARWHASHGSSLLMDYAALELRAEERTIVSNEHWLALVPWWAAWPFETLLLPRHPVAVLPALSPGQRDSLVELLRELLITYDQLFNVSFPYSFGWHGAPMGEGGAPATGWQLHAHFYPPLLRSATVKKFMVGWEMFAESQRDMTPEHAAERLRMIWKSLTTLG